MKMKREEEEEEDEERTLQLLSPRPTSDALPNGNTATLSREPHLLVPGRKAMASLPSPGSPTPCTLHDHEAKHMVRLCLNLLTLAKSEQLS